MSHFRYPSSARRGSFQHFETRATAIEFAVLAAVLGIIVLGAFHMIGIDIAKMAATVLTYL